MVNTLYLPELREMLSTGDGDGLTEFCTALHPARTAEFMEGLEPAEIWEVLQRADESIRLEIFSYFSRDQQLELIVGRDVAEVARLVAELPPDDRVDLLQVADSDFVTNLIQLLPADERRDFLRLREYAEGTAGAVMTTEAAMLAESLSVRDALADLGHQAEELETIYYIYVVDDTDHLRGVVSARQLVSAMGRPDTPLGELMETDLTAVNVMDDQEDVAKKVARYDLLAIPVVDDERRMLGIITHDDIIDVVREEATEDAHRIAAVDPLEEGYLKTGILTLCWKRGMWLIILFVAALLTALALDRYMASFEEASWLILFIPLVISSGGNSGSQSATLIITALATGDIRLSDWSTIIWREFLMGLALGGFLAFIGLAASFFMTDRPLHELAIVPCTLLLVVICGTLSGSLLPLLFSRLGWDPAMMSNPFVAGIIDIVGIVIYMNVALMLL